jgi:hypothetical protein
MSIARLKTGRLGGSVPSLTLQQRKSASLSVGPRLVRAATVEEGHRRSPTVTYGSEEPQVAEPLAHAAAMMQAADSDCGPDGHGL